LKKVLQLIFARSPRNSDNIGRLGLRSENLNVTCYLQEPAHPRPIKKPVGKKTLAEAVDRNIQKRAAEAR